MSVSSAGCPHEFVVAPELAKVAQRLGVPLHAGDRVRFEVVASGASDSPRRRLSRLGNVSNGEHTLLPSTEETSIAELSIVLAHAAEPVPRDPSSASSKSASMLTLAA